MNYEEGLNKNNMAQYYQVLSQSDKTAVEELRQYYPNIVDNPTVQYVISPEEQQSQPFQGQQVRN